MKRQSSEAVIEDSDKTLLNHHRSEQEEDVGSPPLKRQASSSVFDAFLTTTDSDDSDGLPHDVVPATNTFPNDPLPLRDEQRSEAGPSARKVFTKDISRNGVAILNSKQPENETGRNATHPTSHRTGLVFARSPRHFDRANPLHKEREQRILSVEKALDDACLLGKCHVIAVDDGANDLASQPGGAAVSLLSSTRLSVQDFAKVHRPVYLKR